MGKKKQVSENQHAMDLTFKDPIWRSIIPHGIITSTYQEAALDLFSNTSEDILIQATAGSGKTWLLVRFAHTIKLITSGRKVKAIFVAFNRSIADTLKMKLKGTPSTATTAHSLGLSCLAAHMGGMPKVDRNKYRNLLQDEMKTMIERVEWDHKKWGSTADFTNAMGRYISLMMLSLVIPSDQEGAIALAAWHQLFERVPPEIYLPIAESILTRGERIAATRRIISFDEMLNLPWRWDIQPHKKDFVFVDEAQDVSPAILDLILKCRAPGGRMVFVGDRNQRIFDWAGVSPRSIDELKERTNAIEIPLSICYRCGSKIIEIAKKIVPQIEPAPGCHEGEVLLMPEQNIADDLKDGDVVLCRLTAPLVSLCMRLIREGIPTLVRGRDIGDDLTLLARRIAKDDDFDFGAFSYHIERYREHQIEYLETLRGGQEQIEALIDKCEALIAFQEGFDCDSIETLCDKVHSLFTDNETPIVLSTVHRIKGEEYDTVYLLRPDKMPMIWDGQSGTAYESELHLRFVAVTRARNKLVILQPNGMKVDYTDDFIIQRREEHETAQNEDNKPEEMRFPPPSTLVRQHTQETAPTSSEQDMELNWNDRINEPEPEWPETDYDDAMVPDANEDWTE